MGVKRAMQASEKKMNHYYHEIPGRLRVKSPDLKGNAVKCQSAKDDLERHSGVRAVSVNPLTGSIVIDYDPKVAESATMKEVLTRKGYFRFEQAVSSDRYISHNAEKVGEYVGKAVLSACVEKIFQGSPLSLITLLL